LIIIQKNKIIKEYYKWVLIQKIKVIE
jgi:hypothetical protein